MFKLFNDLYFLNFIVIILLSVFFLTCFVFYVKQFGTWIWPVGDYLKYLIGGFCVVKIRFLGPLFFLVPVFLLTVARLAQFIVICISGTPFILFIGMMLIIDKSINPNNRIPVRAMFIGILMILIFVCTKNVLSAYWNFNETLPYEYFKETILPILLQKILPLFIVFFVFIFINLWSFFYQFYKYSNKTNHWISVSLLCTITLAAVVGIVFYKLNVSTKNYVFFEKGMTFEKRLKKS